MRIQGVFLAGRGGGTEESTNLPSPDREDILRALQHNAELLRRSGNDLSVDEASVRRQVDRLLDEL